MNFVARHQPHNKIHLTIGQDFKVWRSHTEHDHLEQKTRGTLWVLLLPSFVTVNISSVSDDWKQELCDPGIQADDDWVDRLVEQISQRQSSLATPLMNLIHSFCFDEILDLLDQMSDAKSVYD